ncbi:hypothetical protein C4901_06990 [Acidiferrobacter sp. SPIII_3]|uniref:PAS domain S-box protein n=1 Tax=Acidiferrobacter sp. SPIII_3 TaxID=1281578 RepID=UPI000D73A661|nr:PAS domain S-box protein [Acidiferrobacter sp. SPIII_3]AWP23106.1 hypothetical protein C4901_06990 [Acidiferrobacter sp. SPIII_3]
MAVQREAWRHRAWEVLGQVSAEAMIGWTRDGRVLVWNDGATRFYGYEAREMIGCDARPLLGIPGHTPWPPADLRGRRALELNRRHKSGTPLAVLAELHPIEDEHGQVIGVAEVGRLAPRTLSMARAQQQAARLHLAAIVESSEDAIVGKSLNGVIQSWNRGAERVFGYRAEEAVGQPVTMLIPPDRCDEEERILAAIRAGERVPPYETIRVRKDGRLIQVSLTISPVYDLLGRVVGASKIARDITAHRAAERALAQAEERLRAVVDAAPVVLFACDAQGQMTLLKGRALESLGFKAEGLIGRPFLGMPGGAAAGFAAQLARALRGERFTAVLGVAGGLVEIRWLPVLGAEGVIAGAGGVAMDITEQRRAQEEALRASKWELFGTLAGGIAHDFNNVLAAIVGNLALARMKLGPVSEAAAFLLESEKAAMRAQGLTRQLLGFAKGERAARGVVDLAALIESTARFALGGSNVRAHVLIARDLWKVRGDEGQLSQVMNNLVINAQQAMPGGGSVEILARNVSLDGHETALPAGDYVRIDCVDRGVGIEEQDVARIFDPFFTTKAQGSGLGLTTSARIVGEHGGRIDVQSRPGEGTRVRFYLPRPSEEAPASQAGGSVRPPKARILFMDDEEPIRKVTQAMLTHLGYEVCVAADGGAALREYRKKRYDIVILDLTVRDGLGGLATLERLRALDPGVVAIVSSGYSSDPVMADHERYGFVAKVPKPYTPETLDAAITPLLGGGGAPHDARRSAAGADQDRDAW